MSTEPLDIPALMRQARTAAAQNKFKEAEYIYSLIMQDSDMQAQLDMKARYAFCLEKNGNIPKSIEYYKEVVEIYKSMGETGAAKAMELKISILTSLSAKKAPRKPVKRKTAQKRKEHPMQSQAQKTSELLGFLDLGTRDLSEQSSSWGALQSSSLHGKYYLGIDTHDVAIAEQIGEQVDEEDDDEITLDLTHFRKVDPLRVEEETIELELITLGDIDMSGH